ncbi:MAG: CBS domain-containing protein [Planctomycetes bacterium]|nr:CBS domain-containing protein [Planctomycetota bacterium]
MSVLKIAHTPPCTVNHDATVLQAVDAMVKAKVGAAAVVKDGKLHGIFTERDLMTRVVIKGLNPSATKLALVVTSPCTSIHSDTTAGEALQLCADHHFRHLPIVDGQGRVQGILSIRDLMESHAEALSRDLDAMASYFGADGIGG